LTNNLYFRGHTFIVVFLSPSLLRALSGPGVKIFSYSHAYLGHDFGGWWIGSQLDVNTTHELCKDMTHLLGFVGPTALQVGASLAAAICWAIMNPKAGANLPEHIPSDIIFTLARPWLGNVVSVRHDLRSVEMLTETSSSDSDDDDSDSDSERTSSSSNSEQSRSREGSESPSRSSRLLDEWQFSNFVASSPSSLFADARL